MLALARPTGLLGREAALAVPVVCRAISPALLSHSISPSKIRVCLNQQGLHFRRPERVALGPARLEAVRPVPHGLVHHDVRLVSPPEAELALAGSARTRNSLVSLP